MKFLRYSIFILWLIIFIPAQSLIGLGMSPFTFKHVGACFNHGFEIYAPMFGSMALSSGFIENLRFYNVVPGLDKETEKRVYNKDKALRDDPVMEIILLLFPSPAGQLTVEGNATSNLGKYFDEKDVATLFNFVHAVRSRLKSKKEHLPKNLEKILKNLEKKDLNDINIFKKKLEEEKKTSNMRISDFNKLLLNIAKALEQEKSSNQKLSKKESLEEERRDEEEREKINTPFYPKHIVEQILSAFFCHKFAHLNNLTTLLNSLHDDIVDKEKIAQIDRLLTKEDITPALENISGEECSLDDIWIALHQESFHCILPYKTNQTPISNGVTKMYSRSSDKKEKEINKDFADCVEVTIRHLMNFIFFDNEKKKFSLDKLDQFMQKKNQAYIQNLQAFYNYQTPELANSGDSQARSLWNRVVADLGGEILYLEKINDADEKNNNELNSGMLNLVRVFNTIFDLNLDEEPKLTSGEENDFKQKVQQRVLNCFTILFKELNPQSATCEINFSNVELFNENDCIGNMQITVKNQEKDLFSFTIRVFNQHIDIQDLKINEQESTSLDHIILEKIASNLNKLSSKASNLNKLSSNDGEASFFLADEFINDEKIRIHPTYKVFGKTLNDTNGKLYSLDQFHNFFASFDKNRRKNIIDNIMQSYLWDDQESVEKFSQQIFNTNTLKNEEFRKIITQETKRLNFHNLNIVVIAYLSEFSRLKELTISDCKNINTLEKLPINIEYLNLMNLDIETPDLSELSRLKQLTINNCKNIKSLENLPKNIEYLNLRILDIAIPDLSEFSRLKKLTISLCKNIKSLENLPNNIEELHLMNLDIEIPDLSMLRELKSLTIWACSNFRSLEKLPANIVAIKLMNLNNITKIINLLKFSKLNQVILGGIQNIDSIIIPDSVSKEDQKTLLARYPNKVTIFRSEERKEE